MKRLLALLLVLTMLFSVATVFAGCEDDGGKKKASSQNEDEDEEEEEEEEEKEDDGKTDDKDAPSEPVDDPSDPVDDPADDPTNPKPVDPSEYEFDDTDGNGPLLYKVTDDKGNVIWLFGSIHVGREDYYPLPDYVIDAFEGSDALAVESDILEFEIDQAQAVKLAMLVMYTDGTTISDHISEETYDAAVEILTDYNQYNFAMDYYKPVVWWQTIEYLAMAEVGGDESLGIDRHLLTTAKKSGKEILEVESAEFQYTMLGGFSPELQEYLLEQSVALYLDLSEDSQSLQEMMDLWQSGNEAAFARYLAEDSETDPEYAALTEEYNNAMIVERNESMTEYAIDALESGKEVFICVGAAHVVGEDAIADNLRELGYTVEIVRDSDTEDDEAAYWETPIDGDDAAEPENEPDDITEPEETNPGPIELPMVPG